MTATERGHGNGDRFPEDSESRDGLEAESLCGKIGLPVKAELCIFGEDGHLTPTWKSFSKWAAGAGRLLLAQRGHDSTTPPIYRKRGISLQQTYLAPHSPETTDDTMIPQERELPRQLLFAMVLSMLLIGLFLLANPIQVSPTVVSTLPFLAAMLPIPFVLFFALWEKRKREGALTLRAGFVFGEAMVRYAAIIFGIFTLVYSFVIVEFVSLQFIVYSGMSAMVGTWILGAACTVLLALVFSRLPFRGESYSSSG